MKIYSLLSTVFTYNTVRHARIQSLRVGIIYRLAQLAILAYIIVWGLIYKKGYQSTEEVSGIVTTKVKGHGFISPQDQPPKEPNTSNPFFFETLKRLNPKLEYRVFDTADYVVPALEYNSIFIMTNFIETTQKKEYCDYQNNEDKCETLNGVKRYMKWSPEEGAEKTEYFIRNTLNFTIFIKNDIEYKKFKIKQRNLFKNMNHTNAYISTCLYHEIYDKFCPVFSLDYALAKAEPDKSERYQMLFKGGVVEINVNWDCNLDIESVCYPRYSFKRFDMPFKESLNSSSGFNFRYTNKFRINNTDFRILYKAFGIRFYIKVTGTAGKFDVIPLMVKIGAGLGLMSITFVIADCVMLYCPCASSKERKYYRKVKRLNAKELQKKKLAELDSFTEIKP